MKKIIIDCDPGIDDAFALFYAMAEPEFDIRLITTVSGNVSIEKTTKNAQRIVAMANKEIEIAKGCHVPLIAKPVFADDIHGDNGMGDYAFPHDETLAPLSSKSALQAQYDVLMNAKEKMVIVAIGPLSNLALLLTAHPEVKEKIEYFAIMGGGLKGENITAAAEFNFYVDPEAAQCVFSSGIPIRMSGLDVTDQAILRASDVEKIKKFGEVGSFLGAVAHGFQGDKSLHDVVAMMSIDQLAHFVYKELFVEIETDHGCTRGYSLADQRVHGRNTGNTTVLLDLNHEKFMQDLLEHLAFYQTVAS